MMTEEPNVAQDFVSETASAHVRTLVPIASPLTQVSELRRSMEGTTFESATHIGVCDDGKLVGVLKIEDLFSALADAKVSDIMDGDPPRVAPGVDQEKAAWKAVQHGESALAVVDDDGRFIGFLPPDRLLAVLLHEHDEDLARMSGFLRDSSMARTASEEPISRRFWHRVPWLLLGLAGAILAADIVGFFERELQANVMIAFFIPGIVYLADAVGTQTEALIIRGLSVGVPIVSVLRRENSHGPDDRLNAGNGVLSDWCLALGRGRHRLGGGARYFRGMCYRQFRCYGAPLDPAPFGNRPSLWQRPAGDRHSGFALDHDLSRDRLDALAVDFLRAKFI